MLVRELSIGFPTHAHYVANLRRLFLSDLIFAKDDPIYPKIGLLVDPCVPGGIESFAAHHRRVSHNNNGSTKLSEIGNVGRVETFASGQFLGQELPEFDVTIAPLFEHRRDVTNQLSAVGVNSNVEPITVQIKKGCVRSLILFPPRIFYTDRIGRGLFANPSEQSQPGGVSDLARRFLRETVAGERICWNANHQRQPKYYACQYC